jgi:hypothetical protein
MEQRNIMLSLQPAIHAPLPIISCHNTNNYRHLAPYVQLKGMNISAVATDQDRSLSEDTRHFQCLKILLDLTLNYPTIFTFLDKLTIFTRQLIIAPQTNERSFFLIIRTIFSRTLHTDVFLTQSVTSPCSRPF